MIIRIANLKENNHINPKGMNTDTTHIDILIYIHMKKQSFQIKCILLYDIL